jgi:N-acetylglucosamine-6-sulfatase
MTDWRTSFFYQYDYERQFPFTPNVRAVRTAEWKYIRYPHGDGGPDRHAAELYDLRSDPLEMRNLAADPAHAADVARLAAELARLMERHGALPDRPALDEGIRDERPRF